MTGTTATHKIPYMTDTDAMASVDNISNTLAAYLDLMQGEIGVQAMGGGADFTYSTRINYVRSYSSLPAGVAPRVVGLLQLTGGANTYVQCWATAEDATGFTLNFRAGAAAMRDIRWVVRVVKV